MRRQPIPGVRLGDFAFDLVIEACTATNTSEELCSYTQYYGVNEASIAGDYGLFGQVQRTYDDNGTDTAKLSVYDAFGRIDRIQYPDDVGLGDSQVTERKQYPSWGAVGLQKIIAFQGRNATWQEIFFDGLGRIIQVHQYAEDGKEIRTTKNYDALGRIAEQWTPYYGTHGEVGPYGQWGYVPAPDYLPHTVMQYTPLGESQRTPDGATSTAFRVGRRHIGIDPNGHRVDTIDDALGRTVEVIEYVADPEVFEAEDWHHLIGSQSGGVWLSPPAGSGAGWLTYGPYLAPNAVGPGQVARFRLAIDITTGDNHLVATIDVYDSTAGQVLTSRDLYRQDFEGGIANFSEFALVFDTSGVSDLDTHNRNPNPTYDVMYHYDETGYGESLGRRIRMTDASGQTTWAYDVRGRVSSETKVINNVSYTIGYTYNAMDQVTTMTYSDGEQVTQTYNNATQPESLTSNLGTYVSHAAYAGAGLLTQFTSGNNVATNYTYNSVSQRLASLQVDDKMSLSYGYDRTGNVLRMDEQDTITFADSFDTKNDSAWVYNTHQTVPFVGGDYDMLRNTGTETTWDANFYRSSYNLSSGEALQVRYKGTQTDNVGILSIETNDGGIYRRFGVHFNHGKVYVEYNDGSGWVNPKDLITNVKPYAWYVVRISLDDAAGFRVEVYDENDASTYASYTRSMSSGKNWRFHHWVARGRVYLDNYLEWSDTQRGAFTYDALNRLTHAEVSGNGSGLYNRTYAYDAIGNLTDKTGVGTYSYNGTVPVSGCTAGTPSTKPHAVDDAGSWSFDYDCTGNMTLRHVGVDDHTFAYNEENKLAEVKLNGVTQAMYTYDGDGTLVKKVVNGQTTIYVGAHFEKNVSTGEVTKYYTLGNRRVAMRKGGLLTYLHGDHLGSASMTTNALGGAGNQMRYYPYGDTRSGSMSTDRRFTGQREETAIGLYDYKARYYDPVIGRFIQADTIVPEPGNPQALNRYAYVYGNPLGYQDPDGHNPLPYLLILAGSYTAGRGTYEAMTVVFPTMDRSRRDRIGGALVTNVADTIAYQAETHSVDSVLVSSVLRHESSAVERRLLTLWPTMQPGIIANGAEWAQSIVKGDTASIGPGQMQLRRARELEEMGYVTPRSSTSERRAALLGHQTSTEYVAGMLHYVNDQLNTLDGFSELGIEEQNRLTLIGYNWGWTNQFERYLREKGLKYMINHSPYDDATLDEYLRWRSEQ